MATCTMKVKDSIGEWRIIPRVDQDGFRKNPGDEVFWQWRVRVKGHPMQSQTFARKTDGRIWAQRTELAIKDGRHLPLNEARRRTVADLIDRYIRDVLPAKKDQKKQKAQLLWWKAEIGAYLLKDVRPALVSEMRDKLAASPGRNKKPKANSTVNRYLAALSHAFTVACREYEWMQDNPVQRVRKGREGQGRVRFLTDDERDKLLSACRESKAAYAYPVVLLALSTGMRRGEILGLEWSDVDLKQGRITLHDTKNGDRRGVPVMGAALAALKDWAKVRRLGDPRVFPGTSNFHRPWTAILEQAEIKDFRFHDLRHSAASYLAMGGASPSEIAGVLGHKTLSMVKRYAHLSDAHLRGVLGEMNTRIFGGEA
jgi:integrase